MQRLNLLEGERADARNAGHHLRDERRLDAAAQHHVRVVIADKAISLSDRVQSSRRGRHEREVRALNTRTLSIT